MNEKEVRTVVDRLVVPKFDTICITDVLNAREKAFMGRCHTWRLSRVLGQSGLLQRVKFIAHLGGDYEL